VDAPDALRAVIEPAALLADDGVARVYFGTGADGPVVVKVSLWPVADVGGRARFEAEVATAAELSRTGVQVPLHGGGVLADDCAYVAMRPCPGGSLEDRLRVDGPLPVAEACRIVADAGLVLSAMHRVRHPHGGITPRKILLAEHDAPVLGLFGIHALDHPPQTVVINGVISCAYLAPEIAFGHHPTRTTDVYSLGAILYGLLAGHPPLFPADRVPSAMEQIDRYRLPVEPHPAVPAELLTIIRRAMRKTPHERHSDAADLTADLAEFLTHHA
jgi:serine/threonine protein kinase